MAMANAGFVFLAMPKTGSTAVEASLSRHAQLTTRRPPRMKHMTARTFDRLIAPVLEHYGHPRESYELVCIVREPVEWAHSWYRYRSRPGSQGRPNYTGDLTFKEFADQVVAGEIDIGSSSNFVRTAPGRPPVERIYRYEHLDVAVGWMAEQLGIAVPDLARLNASPTRYAGASDIPGLVRRRLEEHYARDVEVYEAAR